MTERLEREIEAIMTARLQRPCLFFPSGRLALYVALRARLRPGHRILMSPVTDDVIFFTVLAAGLKPVMAPVSLDDGNIEPTLLPDRTWTGLAAVLTTNLYGLPDQVQDLRRRCDRLGILLIEDAAHAIETEVDGRPIGTFGDLAAFSLSKHVDAHGGGVLAFGDETDRSEFERLRATSVSGATLRQRLTRRGTRVAEELVIGLHLVWPVRWLRKKLLLAERTGYRVPLRSAELKAALAVAPSLEAFHSWVRVDRHDYRLRAPRALLERALRRLGDLQTDRERRIEGVSRLRSLEAAAPGVRKGDPQPLFRVPLLVDDRKEISAELERRLLHIGYIYDPPLDDFAGPEFADPSPSPEAARSWATRVFPVDPLEAHKILSSRRGSLRLN
jgi:dTDP-4-amino-4,6-dideoxygalactose transaminase